MSQIFFENGLLVAQAGAKACQVAHFACINGLSGAEFLAGIPACMGGAAYMNAGCFDREMSTSLRELRLRTKTEKRNSVTRGAALRTENLSFSQTE